MRYARRIVRAQAIAAVMGLATVWAGCGGTEAEPSLTPPAAPPAASGAAEAAEVPEVPAVMPGTQIAWGRYKGSQTCLELFANGDAHLNRIGGRRKVQVIGALELDDAAGATRDEKGAHTLRFDVRRVWQARFTSPCRKHHELGEFTEQVSLLGHSFAAGSHALTLRKVDETQLELCAQSCETLERVPTVLHGRWRLPEMSGAREASGQPSGVVLDLDVESSGVASSGVWISVGPERRWAMLTGTTQVTETMPDHFDLHFEATMVDTGKGVTAPPDTKWRKGSTLDLRVERLPEERLRVCRPSASGPACTVLERMFDAYDHDVH